MSGLSEKAAIAGIGWTPFSSNSGVSTLTLACRAIMAALADAGLPPERLDGVATHRVGDSIHATIVAQALGINDLHYYVDQFGGGGSSHSVVGQAAMAVASGIADYVVCYRAINARSEFRMGGTGRPPVDAIETQYQAPYGYLAPPQQYAMVARAYMLAHGIHDGDAFAPVALTQRRHAMLNPRALMKKPMTMDDYLASRPIVDPFRLFDCCLETDGAVALLVTTAERARDLKKPPVLISGVVWGGGHTLFRNEPGLVPSAARLTAPRLFAMAGMTPADVDVAELYDCFTFTVPLQLEDYGFCADGEGCNFVAEGHAALGGTLPVNTHGGFLSEGYVHGLNHACEAVSQLRGEAGARQVPDARIALSTGAPGYVGGATSALLLRRDG
jgi:acetyl-CoA acetyltransferase